MKKTLLSIALTAALAATVPGSAGAETAAITRLLPAISPVALVIDKPLDSLEKYRAFTAPSGAVPDVAPAAQADALFSLLGLGGAPEGIDLNGPMALAMPQFPFPLIIVSVTDYNLFLTALRGGEPAAPSPAPGLDSVAIAGKPLFARQEGSFALLSPMPLLLTPPQEGAGLGTALSDEEKSLLGGADFFLRLDLGLLLAFVDPLLQQYLAGLTAAGDTPGDSDGGAEGQAAGMAVVKKEVDLLIAGLRQVKAFTLGGTLGENGAVLSNLLLPQPASGFESLLAELRPGRHHLLRYLDGDAAMAGALKMGSESFKELALSFTELMFDSGLTSLTEEDRQRWNSLMKAGIEMAGSSAAYSFGPSGSGGLISALVISEVKDMEKARTLMRDSLDLSEKLLAGTPGYTEANLDMKLETEEYKGIPIDHVSFGLNVPGEEGEEFRSAMDSLFGGGKVHVWLAYFNDLMVASYYVPTAEDLKKMIDRIAAKEEGGLVGSPAFNEATGSLPEENTALFFFSLPRFISLMADMISRVEKDEELPPLPLTEDSASGIGTAYFSAGGALKVDTFLPRREMENIRSMIEYLQALDDKISPAEEKTGEDKPLPL